MARYADTLVEVLDELGIDQATFVGNSMGGLLSIEAALRHPDRVTATMLVCSGGIPLTTLRHRFVLRPGALALNAALRHKRIRHVALHRPRVRQVIAARIVHRPHRVDARYLSEALDGIGARAFGPVLRAALRYDARPHAPRLNRPTLIVWGRHDLLIDYHDADLFEQLIPHSRKVVFEDTGHMAMLEQPERFNELLAGFLDEHPAPLSA